MNCRKTLTLNLSEKDYLTYEKSAHSLVSNRSHNLPKIKQKHILRFFNNSILVKLQYIFEQYKYK